MSYNIAFNLQSRNAKTGPIPVSTTSYATCPTACPLQDNGCYAQSGPLGMYWKKVTEGKAGLSFDAFIAQVKALPAGTFWRHNQAGDLPGDKTYIDFGALMDLVEANKGKRGFTYTHYDPALMYNAAYIRSANADGFTINLSANSFDHADQLVEHDCGPVVTIMPEGLPKTLWTPAGNKVVTCPATYRDDVTCQSCQLCQRVNRDCIVGFPVHGTSKKKANAVFTRNGNVNGKEVH